MLYSECFAITRRADALTKPHRRTRKTSAHAARPHQHTYDQHTHTHAFMHRTTLSIRRRQLWLARVCGSHLNKAFATILGSGKVATALIRIQNPMV